LSRRCRSKQTFWAAKDFCPNFPKLAQEVVVQLLPTVFCVTSKKWFFTCFSANVGRHFFKSKKVGGHFWPGFHRIGVGIWGFCSDFQGYLPRFSGILPKF